MTLELVIQARESARIKPNLMILHVMMETTVPEVILAKVESALGQVPLLVRLPINAKQLAHVILLQELALFNSWKTAPLATTVMLAPELILVRKENVLVQIRYLVVSLINASKKECAILPLGRAPMFLKEMEPRVMMAIDVHKRILARKADVWAPTQLLVNPRTSVPQVAPAALTLEDVLVNKSRMGLLATMVTTAHRTILAKKAGVWEQTPSIAPRISVKMGFVIQSVVPVH